MSVCTVKLLSQVFPRDVSGFTLSMLSAMTSTTLSRKMKIQQVQAAIDKFCHL